MLRLLFGGRSIFLNVVHASQLVADVIEVRIEGALSDAENSEAFDEVLAPVGRNDNLIEHVIVADVLEAP